MVRSCSLEVCLKDPTRLTYFESNKSKADTVGGVFPEPDLHTFTSLSCESHTAGCAAPTSGEYGGPFCESQYCSFPI